MPHPRPGEMMVRVGAFGICHTELHPLDGVLDLGVAPLVPGHASADAVAAIAAYVTTLSPVVAEPLPGGHRPTRFHRRR